MDNAEVLNNMELYNMKRSVPSVALKTITGGRLKGMSDINPQWRIEALTELFGACGIGWGYNVTARWTEEVKHGNDENPAREIIAFTDIILWYMWNGERREVCGTGGSMLASIEKGGIKANDEAYKMATTDAIGVACKQIGIAADVYFNRSDSKHETSSPESVVKPSGITEGQIGRIRQGLATYNIEEKEILERYSLKRLEDMTPDILKKFNDEWETIKSGSKG